MNAPDRVDGGLGLVQHRQEPMPHMGMLDRFTVLPMRKKMRPEPVCDQNAYMTTQ